MRWSMRAAKRDNIELDREWRFIKYSPTHQRFKILGFLVCVALMDGLLAQSVSAAERPTYITPRPVVIIVPPPPVGGFLRTSMGWRWHMCAGPGYPLQPNTVSTKIRPLWSTPGNGFGTYSICPHGVLFLPTYLVGVSPSPGPPRLPPPPFPIPAGGGSNQVPPRVIRTNSVPVLPPTPITPGGFIFWGPGKSGSSSAGHVPFKPHAPHPGESDFPPGPPPGHGPGASNRGQPDR
jgi:hypothetical protein